MKKILLIILIFIFSFNFVFAQSENQEIIGVDHTRGVVADFSEWIVNLSKPILNTVDKLTNNLLEEVDRRQKIFEKEVEERKKNLINKSSKKITEFITDFIDDLLENVKDKLFNPDSDTKPKENLEETEAISF